MICVCVACTLQQPSLFVLSAEQRKVFQSIVSPEFNIAELNVNLLVCINCLNQVKLVQVFRQKALRGAENLIMLYKRIERQTLAQNSNKVKEELDLLPSLTPRKKVIIVQVPKHPGLIKKELQDVIPEEPSSHAREIKQENFQSEKIIVKNEPEHSGNVTISLEPDYGERNIRESSIENVQDASTTITETQSDVPFEVLKHRMLSKILSNKRSSGAANVKPDQEANTRPHLEPSKSSNKMKKRVFLSASEKEEVLKTYKRLCDNWPIDKNKTAGIVQEKTAEIHGISTQTVWRILNSNSVKPVQCKEYGKMLSSNCVLRTHMLAIHTESTPSKCDICGFVCKNDDRLYLHKKKKHPAEGEKTTDALNPEWFCTECQIQFSTKGGFKKHMMTSLKHSTRDQWRFECDTCQRKFPTKTTLEQHVNTQHLKKYIYKCDKCDRAFAKAGRLRAHVAVVHDNQKAKKRYVCHLCGDGFTAPKTLKEHLFKHSGARPYACPLCPATFAYTAALYTHNKLKHLKIKPKLYQKNHKRGNKKEKKDAEGIDEDSKEGDTGGTEMEDTEQTETGETKKKKRKRTVE